VVDPKAGSRSQLRQNTAVAVGRVLSDDVSDSWWPSFSGSPQYDAQVTDDYRKDREVTLVPFSQVSQGQNEVSKPVVMLFRP